MQMTQQARVRAYRALMATTAPTLRLYQRLENGRPVECDFSGYAPQPLDRWGGDELSLTHPFVRFACDQDLRAAQYAAGAYVQAADGMVLGDEPFGGEGRRFVSNGDALELAVEVR